MSFPRFQQYPQLGTATLQAGQELRVPKGGSFIRVRKADQEFSLKFDDGMVLSVAENDVFRFQNGDRFKSFSVINSSTGTLNFQLEVGDGSVETSKLTISGDIRVRNANAPNDRLNTEPRRGSRLNSLPPKIVFHDQPAVQIVTEKEDRIGVNIYNMSVGHTLWIGDSNVDSDGGRGYPVPPQGHVSFGANAGGFSGAIYAHNTSGQDISIAMLEELI